MRRSCPWRAGIVSLLLVILANTSALADTTSGTVARYRFPDSTSSPGATCNYTPNYPNHYLVSVSVKAPSVWWVNASASNKRENGTVGWAALLQQSTGAWHTVASTAQQRATAFEDRPRYDAADRAPFSNRGMAWSAIDQEMYRVQVQATWYRSDASVMGQVTHRVIHYRLAFSGWSAASSDSCPGRITILG